MSHGGHGRGWFTVVQQERAPQPGFWQTIHVVMFESVSVYVLPDPQTGH